MNKVYCIQLYFSQLHTHKTYWFVESNEKKRENKNWLVWNVHYLTAVPFLCLQLASAVFGCAGPTATVQQEEHDLMREVNSVMMNTQHFRASEKIFIQTISFPKEERWTSSRQKQTWMERLGDWSCTPTSVRNEFITLLSCLVCSLHFGGLLLEPGGDGGLRSSSEDLQKATEVAQCILSVSITLHTVKWHLPPAMSEEGTRHCQGPQSPGPQTLLSFITQATQLKPHLSLILTSLYRGVSWRIITPAVAMAEAFGVGNKAHTLNLTINLNYCPVFCDTKLVRPWKNICRFIDGRKLLQMRENNPKTYQGKGGDCG